MKVTICIGSACHLKGSREIISKLQKLVDENGLSDKVDLNGAFCSGNCDHGVCVTVEGELYSLKPEDTEEFFENEIKGRLLLWAWKSYISKPQSANTAINASVTVG